MFNRHGCIILMITVPAKFTTVNRGSYWELWIYENYGEWWSGPGIGGCYITQLYIFLWILATRPRDAEINMRTVSSYLSLDHVDSPRAQFPHTVVNVYNTFSFCHVQHDVNDDEAACPSGPGTVDRHMHVYLH